MDIFIEKGFIENFEIEYDPKKCSRVQAIIYKIFAEYTGIKLFIDVSESELENFISNSELLSNLFNYNPCYNCIDDFYYYITTQGSSYQTLVFTEEKKDWFSELIKQNILCFCWEDYESSITKIIKKIHFRIDLSDKEFSLDWGVFNYISENTSFLILSDTYILKDGSGQKIKDNILRLIQNNIDSTKDYKLFIITSPELSHLSEKAIKEKLTLLNTSLANYKIKIYLFNRLKACEKTTLHDRLLYTNYSIADVGIGYNLHGTESNSEIRSESIFEKFAYRKHKNHMELIKNYIIKLETWEDYNNPYKTNSKKAYEEFYNALK